MYANLYSKYVDLWEAAHEKVLADLRVKQPNSSRIQLGISYSSLTMILSKK